jgi:hypothetical protein
MRRHTCSFNDLECSLLSHFLGKQSVLTCLLL